MGKKALYISLFTLLGLLVQFVLNGGVEIASIYLLTHHYDMFGLGLSFETWSLVHRVFAVLLLVLGLAFGMQQGFYWWKRLYEGKK